MVEKDDYESWNFAQRLIRPCYSEDFKTTSFTAAHFRVQISPKYIISSFTRTTELYNIKLVPNIWNTSFNQPAEISIDSSADVALIQLVPKYQKWKLKPIILFWNNCSHGKLGQMGKFLYCIASNGDTHIVWPCRWLFEKWFWKLMNLTVADENTHSDVDFVFSYSITYYRSFQLYCEH